MATMEGISRCMCWWALHLNGPLCLQAQTAAGLRLPLLCKGLLVEEQQASADAVNQLHVEAMQKLPS